MYLASRIIELMPPRCKNPGKPDADDPGWLHYVEPYAGGLAVLLANDPEGISEVVNDKNTLLMNFWGCLANPQGFAELKRLAEATPFSELMWQVARQSVKAVAGSGVDVLSSYSKGARMEMAHAFLVYCRQSLAGRMDSFAPLTRNRTRRGMNEQASAWLGAIEGLQEVHERLKRVVILCDEATKVILSEDSERTLFYLDPPYYPYTRTSPNVYQHEMDARAHQRLLDELVAIKGRFILSGYRNALYDECATANRWRRVDFDLPNNSASGSEKRRMTESCWMNY